MGQYNVVAPCVVEGKHYTRPAGPITVDDKAAAPLVEAGKLEALTPVSAPKPEPTPVVVEDVAQFSEDDTGLLPTDDEDDEQPPSRRRRRG